MQVGLLVLRLSIRIMNAPTIENTTSTSQLREKRNAAIAYKALNSGNDCDWRLRLLEQNHRLKRRLSRNYIQRTNINYNGMENIGNYFRVLGCSKSQLLFCWRVLLITNPYYFHNVEIKYI